MADCVGCAYPSLECPCCCKQKAVLQGLVNRVSGYECYLKTFTVPASCNGLSDGTLFPGIIGGENASYKLGYTHANVGTTPDTANFAVKLWPAVGCQCSFTPYAVPLYKTLGSCWGTVPLPGANTLVNFASYLSSTYGAGTDLSVVQLISSNSASNVTSLSAIKGARDWAQEIRKVYGSILLSLPC